MAKEFPDDLAEIRRDLVDGDFLLVNKTKALLSRVYTYVAQKLFTQNALGRPLEDTDRILVETNVATIGDVRAAVATPPPKVLSPTAYTEDPIVVPDDVAVIHSAVTVSNAEPIALPVIVYQIAPPSLGQTRVLRVLTPTATQIATLPPGQMPLYAVMQFPGATVEDRSSGLFVEAPPESGITGWMIPPSLDAIVVGRTTAAGTVWRLGCASLERAIVDASQAAAAAQGVADTAAVDIATLQEGLARGRVGIDAVAIDVVSVNGPLAADRMLHDVDAGVTSVEVPGPMTDDRVHLLIWRGAPGATLTMTRSGATTINGLTQDYVVHGSETGARIVQMIARSSDDWTIVASASEQGNAQVAGTAPIRINGGENGTIGDGITVSINAATTASAGSMSADDKAKLDGITAGTWSPSATNAVGLTGTPDVRRAVYESIPINASIRRIRCDVVVTVTRFGAGPGRTVHVSLPVDPGANFTDTVEVLSGVASTNSETATRPRVFGVNGARTAQITCNDTETSGNMLLFAHFSYEAPL